MTSETNKSTNVADKMKSVKATCDNAPSGPQKETALKHYRAAEKAQTVKNDAEAHKELDAATQALK